MLLVRLRPNKSSPAFLTIVHESTHAAKPQNSGDDLRCRETIPKSALVFVRYPNPPPGFPTPRKRKIIRSWYMMPADLGVIPIRSAKLPTVCRRCGAHGFLLAATCRNMRAGQSHPQTMGTSVRFMLQRRRGRKARVSWRSFPD